MYQHYFVISELSVVFGDMHNCGTKFKGTLVDTAQEKQHNFHYVPINCFLALLSGDLVTVLDSNGRE